MFPIDSLSLFKDLNELKRIKSNSSNGLSFAERAFGIGVQCCDCSDSFLSIHDLVKKFIAGSRLGFLGHETLSSTSLSDQEIVKIYEESLHSYEYELRLLKVDFDLHKTNWTMSENIRESPLRSLIKDHISQPRAGVTCPDKPRVVLQPTESHGDHCIMVAVYAYLLSPFYDSDPIDAFTIGLFHHLHNCILPDSGFAGECILGNCLNRVIDSARATTASVLSVSTKTKLDRLFKEIEQTSSPVAKAFHAADCIDRVLQLQYYEKAHGFSVSDAIEKLNLIHDGPAKTFQMQTLQSCGLL